MLVLLLFITFVPAIFRLFLELTGDPVHAAGHSFHVSLHAFEMLLHFLHWEKTLGAAIKTINRAAENRLTNIRFRFMVKFLSG